MPSDEELCELARRSVLSNDLLTKWLVHIERRLRRLENLLSPQVTWGVGKAELAETKKVEE